MNYNQLIEKAQLLVKDCCVFVKALKTDVVWGYISKTENQDIEFVVMHNKQWMGLCVNAKSDYFFQIVSLESLDLDKYTALTTKSIKVYPNFEHLLHFGDAELQEFIKQNNCNANDLFDLQSINDKGYIDLWMQNHPMYNADGIYAFGGGWAMIWPEDDIALQWNEQLVFLYQVGLQEEPFIEIYFNVLTQEFICLERNT